MGKLTEDDIRLIIKRASIIQQFHQKSNGQEYLSPKEDYEDIYSIGENLSINKQFINEAIQEFQGIESSEPVSIDTGDSSKAKIIGYANGSVNSAVFQEIRAMLEYHFNTVGKTARRKGNIYWMSNPSGVSRLFETSKSPKLEIAPSKNGQKLTLTQNLSTYNKFNILSGGLLFIAALMFGAVIFNGAGSDGTPPLLITSGLFTLLSFALNRRIKNKRAKKKVKLVELIEDIQQVLERKFRAEQPKQEVKKRIKIPDLEDIELEDEVTLGEKAKS